MSRIIPASVEIECAARALRRLHVEGNGLVGDNLARMAERLERLADQVRALERDETAAAAAPEDAENPGANVVPLRPLQ